MSSYDDRKVIKFPGATTKMAAKSSADPVTKLTVGPMSFHCSHCGETCHADFKKMIFRTVEFYCASCGNFFKITNPAFSALSPKIKK